MYKAVSMAGISLGKRLKDYCAYIVSCCIIHFD